MLMWENCDANIVQWITSDYVKFALLLYGNNVWMTTLVLD